MTAFQVPARKAIGYNATLLGPERKSPMFDRKMTVAGFDDEVWSAIRDEERRQEDNIELIASENYASPRVLQAQGTVLTNKYAEGYPSKRYYGGCEYVDRSSLAIDRVKALFGATSRTSAAFRSQANAAVILRCCRPVTSYSV